MSLIVARHRMACLIGDWNKLLIHGSGNLRIPVTGCFRKADDSDEEHGDSSGHRPDGNLMRRRFVHPQVWERQPQSVLCRTDCDAFEASGTLGGFDRDELIDRQRRGARFGAFRALNAAFRVAANARGTEEGNDAQ